MTKTEAAEIMALDVRVWALLNNRREITQELVEERISEAKHSTGPRTYKTAAATVANWRTTLRIARREWRAEESE